MTVDPPGEPPAESPARSVAALLTMVGLPEQAADAVTIVAADPVYASPFPVASCAATVIAATAAAAAWIWRDATGQDQQVRIDTRRAAASLISFVLQRIDGQSTGGRPDRPLVSLYRCGDGRWIHLHGGFPGLAATTAAVLGFSVDADRETVAAAVARWSAAELEDALAAAGTCGAMIRTQEEWADHPQGRAVAAMPLVSVEQVGDAPAEAACRGGRPLAGIRALDLTRVLAGPACGRLLAEHGADVLLVSSPNLPSIPEFVIDTSHGKRSAVLDLDDPRDAATLRALAGGADVFTQGYRSGALARRGFGVDDLVAMRPGITAVTINCYGDAGPWRERPGWEQLAQSVSGIAAENGSPDAPALIAAAACDYTTGNLAALGVLGALWQRGQGGGSHHVRASLCQTAAWFTGHPRVDPSTAAGLGDLAPFMTTSDSPFGRVEHLAPVAELSVTPARWELPTAPIGTHAPVWLPDVSRPTGVSQSPELSPS